MLSKQETFTQCWFDDGPASYHQTNIQSTAHVQCVVTLKQNEIQFVDDHIQYISHIITQHHHVPCSQVKITYLGIVDT